MSEEQKKKTKKTKRKPPTVEEVDAMSKAAIAEISSLANFFTGDSKKRLTLPEDAPEKGEYTAVMKQVAQVVGLYKKLYALKKTKKKTKKNGNAGSSSNTSTRGFKQPRFVKPDGVVFVNKHGDLPDSLKLKPIDEAGHAIWNIAQATQLFGWYTNQKELKNPQKRSELRLDAVLLELFEPYMSDLTKKQLWKKGNETWISHAALQHLVPLLFQKSLPVLPEMLTEDVTKALDDREKILKERTAQGKAKREAAAKAARAAEKAEKAEKAAAEAAAAAE